MSGDDKEILCPEGNLKMDDTDKRSDVDNHRFDVSRSRFDVGNPRHEFGNHRFDFASHRGKPMKRSDIEHLAMLKAKAKSESGKFTCVDFFKAMLFIGIVTAFTFVFYRIAVLKHEIDSATSRIEIVRNIALSEARNRPCNCTPRSPFGMSSAGYPYGRHRGRRSATEQEQENEGDASLDNEIDSQFPSDNDRFAVHLLPTSGNKTLTPGDLFNWTDTKDHSFIQPGGFELIDDRYLFVPVAGYYFVYSQITFNDSLTRTIGHQVVTWGRCGRGGRTTLMGTSLTQQRRPVENLQTSNPQDSSYVGGVVYLAAGDFVAVRPSFGSGTNNVEYSQLDPNTFFGAFLINRDVKGPSVKENCVL